MKSELTYETIYTLSLGGRSTHPYWHYEKGCWLDCDCPECRQLRIDDPEATKLAKARRELNNAINKSSSQTA